MSLGLKMHVDNVDALNRFRGVLERATSEQLNDAVFWPFVRWVLKNRIPQMYWNKGRVSGADGQPAWYALSKWTIASKGVGNFIGGFGARGSTLGPMTTSQMRMARSYAIGIARTGTHAWRFEMTNTARSTSRWSPGFDYPSALHEGWGPYTVRPRPDGPGFLAWPMRKGTVIGGRMGRESTAGSLLRSGAVRLKDYKYLYRKKGKASAQAMTVTTDAMFAMETHPSGAPARPHIKFFQIDVAKLGALTLDFVVRGVKAA